MIMKNDKLIYNIENTTISYDGSSFDRMARVPYVVTDPNGFISVAGKDKTLILINGRHIKSNDELKILNSLRIKQIEIIENPSAKYEAEGHAILNIITRKSLGEGYHGSVNASYRQGRKPTFSITPELSYEINDWRFYAAFSGELAQSNNLRKIWTKYDIDNYQFESVANGYKRIRKTKDFTYNVGMDYMLNAKSTIHVYFDGYLMGSEVDDASDFDIQRNSIKSPTLQTLQKENEKPRQTSVGLNYDYKNDADLELTFFNNYTNYSINNIIYITETNLDSWNNYQMKNFAHNQYDLFTSKLDILVPASFLKGNFEFGGKYSNVTSHNDALFERFTNKYWVVDEDFTSMGRFNEQILGGYLLLSGNLKKIRYSFGVRIDNAWTDNKFTGIKGNVYRKSKFGWFPNASINYTYNSTTNYQLSYSKRISRPNYSSLENSTSYLDSLSVLQGNPLLKPTIYNTISLNASFNRKVNVGVSYSRIQAPQDRLSINDKENIERYMVFITNVKDTWLVSANIGANFRFKKWATQPSASFVYRPVTIIDDEAEYTFKHPLFRISSVNQIELPKEWNLDLNAFFYKPAHSFMTFGKQFSIDVGISKKLLNNSIIVQCLYHHAFNHWTQEYDYSYKQYKLDSDNDYRYSFQIRIGYTFGRKKTTINLRKGNYAEVN